MKNLVLLLSFIFLTGRASAQCYSVAPIAYEPDTFTAGTPIAPMADDQWSTPLQIGFPFCFYGNQYDKILAGTNSVLTFDTTQSGMYCPWPITSAIPTSADPMISIMMPWQDLLPAAYGAITIAHYGTSPNRTCAISYDSVTMYHQTNEFFTGQVVLHETSGIIDIFIHHKTTVAWNGSYAILGIQDQSGVDGTCVPGRNYPSVWTSTDEGWEFTPTCSNICTFAGINENVNRENLVVFPNPAGNELHFSLNSQPGYCEARLYDINGKAVREEALQSYSSNEWNIADLSEGIYLLVIRNENGVVIAREKVIKY